jgi:regulator of replication initiation timing
MNFKNMTYREITRMISTVNNTTTIDEATRQLDDLIESFKILRNMLEGSKALQMQKDKLKRRRGLKVITKGNKRRD